MRISSLNSKKCLTASRSIRSGALCALLLALTGPAWAAAVPGPGTEIIRSLRHDLEGRTSNSFSSVLSRWELQYGPAAVDPLLEITADRRTSDPERYIALMGATKLGGAGVASRIVPLLKDPSWMIRSAALRALCALNLPETGSAVLPLLRDPALVVRVEAVDALAKLHPKGTEEQLVESLFAPANYHGGKAQWVPQHALAALASLHAKAVAPKLRPLLDHREDPELQARTIETLALLTGRALPQTLPLRDKVRIWQTALKNLN